MLHKKWMGIIFFLFVVLFISPSIEAACTPYAFGTATVSDNTPAPNQIFKLRCNYGTSAPKDCVRGKTNPNRACTYSNTTAAGVVVFNCTAPATVATYHTTCSMVTGTASDCCARTNAGPAYTVVVPTATPIPPSPTPRCIPGEGCCGYSCPSGTQCYWLPNNIGGYAACLSGSPTPTPSAPTITPIPPTGVPGSPTPTSFRENPCTGVRCAVGERCVELECAASGTCPTSVNYECQKLECKPACPAGQHCVDRNCPPGANCVQSIDPYCVPDTITPTLPPNTDCPKKSLGDANCDGVVDSADLVLFKSAVNSIMRSWSGSYAPEDFNSDNKVDLIDLEIWRKTVNN